VQLHPTRTAVDLTFAAIFVVVVGLIAERAAIVAWGGALLLGLVTARSVTLLGVARIRSAGFEMLWQEQRRRVRVAVGETVRLEAEVRNRDDRAARYVELRSVHSPHLSVTLEPNRGEVPAGGRLSVAVEIRASRTGRHGLYGLSLEVQGGPGLYEVPLTFANPFGVEAMPRVYSMRTRPAIGGRSRSHADAGRPGKRPNGNYELREIRAYQPGDAFKRVAWKASARRGRLMVREFDIEEREVVWLVLDASVELWAGPSGGSPLDWAIDATASLAEHHLQLGNRVGVAVVGGRQLAWLPPAAGAAHAARVMEVLAFSSHTHDFDRSGLDSGDIAHRVAEHLRPLSAAPLSDAALRDHQRLAKHAHAVLGKAPFDVISAPVCSNPADGALRAYLMAFGIDSPPKVEPERSRTDLALMATLTEISKQKPHPSLVVVCSPLPEPNEQATLIEGLSKWPRRRGQLRWLPVPLEHGLEDMDEGVAQTVAFAVRLRTEARAAAGSEALRRIGVRVERPERRRPALPKDETAQTVAS